MRRGLGGAVGVVPPTLLGRRSVLERWRDGVSGGGGRGILGGGVGCGSNYRRKVEFVEVMLVMGVSCV